MRNNNQNTPNFNYYPNVADIIYGSYIKYDRLFEMTKFAFYGKTDAQEINIYIDVYSILKGIFTKGTNIKIDDSYVIASCIINLAIHLRAYFETRHRVSSKIFIIYGAARPVNAISIYPSYNARNIQMEDSNSFLKRIIKDNLDVISILCPYLYDIFAVIDYDNEFSTIASALIDSSGETGFKSPNVIYSKEPLAYQLVAFKPRTFLYRSKKRAFEDCSWVVTKSTLYNAYRYAELELSKEIETTLDVKMFSIYQSIAGLKSRTIPSIKNANSTIKVLEKAIKNNVFSMGYNVSAVTRTEESPFEKLALAGVDCNELIQRFSAIDLNYQTMLYKATPNFIGASSGIINLYNPQEVRNINDKYFQTNPLDLNRV